MPQSSDMRQEILPHRLVAEQQQPPPELAILNFAGQRGRWPSMKIMPGAFTWRADGPGGRANEGAKDGALAL